jgi:hypothetical protein
LTRGKVSFRHDESVALREVAYLRENSIPERNLLNPYKPSGADIEVQFPKALDVDMWTECPMKCVLPSQISLLLHNVRKKFLLIDAFHRVTRLDKELEYGGMSTLV